MNLGLAPLFSGRACLRISTLSLALAGMPQVAGALDERFLVESFESEVLKFFEGGRQGKFQSHHATNAEISFRVFPNTKQDRWIAISPGRGESQWIYAELILDLHRYGFSVAIMDHYGQGESSVSLPHKPYIQTVESFSSYSADFSSFLRQLFRDHVPSQAKLGILAHSAGSIIALDAIGRTEFPRDRVQSIAMTAPMFRIRTEPVPFIIAEPLSKLLAWFAGDSPSPGQTPRYLRDFERFSRIKKPERRRSLLRSLHYRKFSRTALVPSINWAREALVASRRLREGGLFQDLPSMVLDAGNDKVVEPLEHGSCERHLISESAHDIWLESDLRRNFAIEKVLGHFEKTLN